MFQLRFILRDSKKILQYRYVPVCLSDAAIGSWIVEPEHVPSKVIEENYTEWEDVPLVLYGDQIPSQ